MLDIEKQLEIIFGGAVTLVPLDELKVKLAQERPLKIKLGADPTAPDLHLGHAVPLAKLRQLQDLGHNVLFIIGDFTAQIGDPTGKSKTRPPLSVAEIKRNAETYLAQVFRILDKDKTEILFNSSWFESFPFAELIKLCGKTTLMRLVEREDFKNRISEQTPIGFHELLYPILQGYDSVFLHADLEVGGTDQTFNLMFGRHLQEQFGQSPQIVLTMPLLEGLDGKQKMSKSLANYVGLTDSPQDAYGKLMSMPDSNLINYNRLLLGKNENELASLSQALADGTVHPMTEKKRLAFAIVAKFWGEEAAQIGQHFFEQVFQKHNYADALVCQVTLNEHGQIWVVDLLRQAKCAQSSSEAKRLIEQGAVCFANNVISDFKVHLRVEGDEILKVGKKIVRCRALSLS